MKRILYLKLSGSGDIIHLTSENMPSLSRRSALLSAVFLLLQV